MLPDRSSICRFSQCSGTDPAGFARSTSILALRCSMMEQKARTSAASLSGMRRRSGIGCPHRREGPMEFADPLAGAALAALGADELDPVFAEIQRALPFERASDPSSGGSPASR
jgi:hypothetical protein